MQESTIEIGKRQAVRRCSAFVLALTLHGSMLLLTRTARATEASPVEVCQPILVDDGIILSRCTYIESLGSAWPGLEIGFTARANSLLVSGMRSEDRNAAHLYGIEVRVEPDPEWSSRSYAYSDTVASATVIVDAGRAKKAGNFAIDVVIRATVEAILVNAAAHRPHIRVLRVNVLGNPTLARYGGVFHLQRLGRLPRTRVFD